MLFSAPLLVAQDLPRVVEKTIVLWDTAATGVDSIDQCAFESTFTAAGYAPLRVSGPGASGGGEPMRMMLVVPCGAARRIPPDEVRRIIHDVSQGLTVISDGDNPLTHALGVGLASPTRVTDIADAFRPDIRPFWSDTPSVAWFSDFPRPSSRVIYSDAARGFPLGLILHIGRGQCLLLAPLLDTQSGRGYSRFASLPRAVAVGLGRVPPFIRRGVDAYFDAGFRPGVPPDSLARMWRSWGIRAIHAAAWYAYSTPAYDYGALIRALHRHGILAYAWLEWPYIGKEFWDNHPEWRQKNALLRDAHLDFLYLMDLQNRDCMRTAVEDLERLLGLDWDGVDVAEFTMTGAVQEALAGPSRPDYFTGFTDVSRAEFRRREGFDPLAFFDTTSPHFWKVDTAGLKLFYRYRTSVNEATQDTLFSAINRMKLSHNRSWEIFLTIIDNSIHPEFDDLLGFSLKTTVRLVDTFHLTLHVEDPLTEWLKPPDRYRSMGEFYRSLLGSRTFMIDINVVPVMPARRKFFSTPQPIGTEFLELLNSASRNTDRVCFYCESSIPPADWELVPSASAVGASISMEGSRRKFNTPHTVIYTQRTEGKTVWLDGHPWPAKSDSEIIIPRGVHTLELRVAAGEARHRRLEIRSITGELIRAQWRGEKLQLEYDSPARCMIALNRRPLRILVDNIPSRVSMELPGSAGILLAPQGRHQLVIE